MAEQEKEPYYFNISLNVLDHLGRNLYRNFITVLGEAISNSWDAGAKNVRIKIDNKNGCFSIKDDGVGMDETDFRKKFLNVGYSRRQDNKAHAPEGRPLIGGKGIGKLALLSCARKIHIRSKKNDGTDYTGVLIDNDKLDEQIGDNSAAVDCKLEEPNKQFFEELEKEHKHGTIIYFENVNEGINNKIETLRKLIALYFRFSLIDPSFSIYVDETPIGFSDLGDLSASTQFLWTINEFNDPFLETLKILETKEPKDKFEQLDIPVSDKTIEGFIASVEKPSHLNIFGAGEKIGIDVFVNGRLRETNILKHKPTFASRVVASYLYGQIHLNTLDDVNSENNSDKFTTDREGIKLDDKMYQGFLETIEKEIFNRLSTQWDKWRIGYRQDGDPDETGNLSKSQRGLKTSKEEIDKAVGKQIDNSNTLKDSTKVSLKETLLKLSYDNIKIYQDLFVLENLLRRFLKENGISDEDDLPTDEAFKDCLKKLETIMKSREEDERGHPLQDNIFENPHVLDYFDLVCLGILTDIIEKNTTGRYKVQTMEAHLKDIMPIRNAIMHTNKVSDHVIDYNKIKSVIRLVDELRDKPKPTPNP